MQAPSFVNPHYLCSNISRYTNFGTLSRRDRLGRNLEQTHIMSPTADTSRAGIRKLSTGESVIPSSTRPDGSVRKEIRVKPGYKPPEDVEVYKNRTAHAFKNRGKGGVVGAEAVEEEKAPLSAAAGKNAKRREARKKAAAAGEGGEGDDAADVAKPTNESSNADTAPKPEEPEAVDPEVEKAKEARKLAKKLRNARELKDKLASVIKIQELIRQLDNLGFDSDGQKKDALKQDTPTKAVEKSHNGTEAG